MKSNAIKVRNADEITRFDFKQINNEEKKMKKKSSEILPNVTHIPKKMNFHEKIENRI